MDQRVDSASDAVEVVGRDRSGPALILCDHASNRVPEIVAGGDLGLSAADMARHIAYDVGAAGVARRLADLLDAPLVLSRFSRLVIDPNRGEDDPTLVMRLYDGSIIPANRAVDEAEIERRRALFHRPYHRAITDQIDAMLTAKVEPRLVSIHSFTPQLRGRPPRPWHVGLLWDRDGRLARPLVQSLSQEPDLCVGDNEPYSGQLRGDSMYQHGTARGLPHILIEVRNDLISGEEGQAAWAARLAQHLAPLLERGGLGHD
ncbi:MAG: N-formylglutamate amidohydrolase [Pseudomonadota bacterium]